MLSSSHWRPRAAVLTLAGALVLALTNAPSFARTSTSATTTYGTPAGTTTNLLPGSQGNFDQGTASWLAYGGQVGWTAQPAQAGAGSLSVTTLPSGTGGVWLVSGNGPSTWAPAVAGQRYELTGWFEAATTSRPIQAFDVFYDSSGAQIGSVLGPVVWDGVGSWSQPLPTEGLAPARSAYVAAGAVIWGSVSGEVHYLDSAVLTTSGPQASTNVVGPLHTSGSRIVQANGRPIVFRGVQWSGMAIDSTPLTDPVAAQMKAWGVNFVRISIAEPYWLNTDCHYDAGYVSKVDGAVNAVTSRGMVALVTLMNNDGNTCAAVGPQPMADTGSPTFWQQVAARYKSNPLVMFDLYNEPHDISDATWLNGGQVTWNGFSFLAAGMQQLYAAVRSTGASNVVVTSGKDWANNPPSTLVQGSGIVLGAHAYTCPTVAPPTCSSPTPYDPSGILNSFLGVSTYVPVVVTEWGWPDSGNGLYAQALIGYAEAHGWGWNAYTWYPYTGANFNLVASQGNAYEPTASGMPVLAGLTANNGPNP